MADLQSLAAGELVVGASSTVGEQLLPSYLGRFHAAHPNVRLSVRIGNSVAVSERVSARELDFAIVGNNPWIRLVSEPIFADQIVAFVAPGDPLLRQTPIAPLALCGRQFVLREAGSATRALAERCLYETSCGPGHVIEFGSNEAVKRAVEAGLGIGLLSTHTIAGRDWRDCLLICPLRGGRARVRSGLFGGEIGCLPGLRRRFWHSSHDWSRDCCGSHLRCRDGFGRVMCWPRPRR